MEKDAEEFSVDSIVREILSTSNYLERVSSNGANYTKDELESLIGSSYFNALCGRSMKKQPEQSLNQQPELIKSEKGYATSDVKTVLEKYRDYVPEEKIFETLSKYKEHISVMIRFRELCKCYSGWQIIGNNTRNKMTLVQRDALTDLVDFIINRDDYPSRSTYQFALPENHTQILPIGVHLKKSRKGSQKKDYPDSDDDSSRDVYSAFIDDKLIFLFNNETKTVPIVHVKIDGPYSGFFIRRAYLREFIKNCKKDNILKGYLHRRQDIKQHQGLRDQKGKYYSYATFMLILEHIRRPIKDTNVYVLEDAYKNEFRASF